MSRLRGVADTDADAGGQNSAATPVGTIAGVVDAVDDDDDDDDVDAGAGALIEALFQFVATFL